MIAIAQSGLLILLSLFLLLHIIIVLKIIPYNLVWGGRLKSDKEMYRFEIFSILVNALFIGVVFMNAGFWTIDFPEKILTYALWLMTGMFSLNTFGNAFSKNKIEKMLFTPVTILLTVFSAILAWSN